VTRGAERDAGSGVGRGSDRGFRAGCGVPKTWGNRAGFNAKNQGRRWEFVRLEAEEISFSVGSWAFVLLEGDEMA